MRIVVTGAAGFIGSHLSERLVRQGHEVIGLDAFVPYYPRRAKEANLVGLRADPRFTFYEVDLRTAALEPLLDGADAIVNEAAMAGLARSWEDFPLYAGCNLIALERLARAALTMGVRKLVHASTSSVYGEHAVGDESVPERPVSPYGVTKLAAEHLLLAFARAFELPVTILRYFSIYGPRQRPDMAYHRFIEAMLDGRPITVTGDGHQSRSNTYVDDCVEATVLAIERGRSGEIYNIGGGATLQLLEAIKLIATSVGTRPEIQHAPAPPGDQRHTAADIGKARRELGYEPRVEPAEGIRRQVDWHVRRRRAAKAA